MAAAVWVFAEDGAVIIVEGTTALAVPVNVGSAAAGLEGALVEAAGAEFPGVADMAGAAILRLAGGMALVDDWGTAGEET